MYIHYSGQYYSGGHSIGEEVVFNHKLYSSHTAAAEPVSVLSGRERKMDAPEQSHQGS